MDNCYPGQLRVGETATDLRVHILRDDLSNEGEDYQDDYNNHHQNQCVFYQPLTSLTYLT